MGTTEVEGLGFCDIPVEREDTLVRKRKAITDVGSLLRNGECKGHLIGAFQEGWSPKMCSSLWKNKGEAKRQNVCNLLIEEEIKELGEQPLETSLKLDTVQFTAAEPAIKLAEKRTTEQFVSSTLRTCADERRGR
ncbi:hypothetical protein HPP92_003096 [Vanilla planifolia]|uniref:Uncharacterized protein n=1 Tax=Vanilla planifolia TaxID=51239 RepID=A0A835S145_VANPL|nr:hypothetical protein HPP92_003096 [Vanilla planifolia]